MHPIPALKRTVDPTSEPLTLPEAKAHLNILSGEKDTEIRDFLKSAREDFEDATGRVLMTQTFEQVYDWFPTTINLVRAPVQSVTKIEYIDTEGVLTLLATSEYVLDSHREPARIVEAFGVSWPTTRQTVNAVIVTFVAGYTSRALVPHTAKEALKLKLGQYFEDREAVVMGGAPVGLPQGWDALVAKNWVPQA